METIEKLIEEFCEKIKTAQAEWVHACPYPYCDKDEDEDCLVLEYGDNAITALIEGRYSEALQELCWAHAEELRWEDDGLIWGRIVDQLEAFLCASEWGRFSTLMK